MTVIQWQGGEVVNRKCLYGMKEMGRDDITMEGMEKRRKEVVMLQVHGR